MRFKIILFLSLLMFALMVQSTYPTLNIDVSAVELIENNEDFKNIPLIKAASKTAITLIAIDTKSSKRFHAANDNIKLNNTLEVVVPPPKA